MNINEIKSAIENNDFNNSLNLLYKETDIAKERYTQACNGFIDVFGEENDIRLFSAPGRTEIAGNHTDHQHGSVLTASVNLDVIAVVAPNNDGKIRIKSEGYAMDIVGIDDLSIKDDEKGKSSALIRGVCKRFKEMGYKVSGFNAYTTSNVLKGSGLSSSAAFEVLIGTILNNLFANGEVSPTEIAKIGQFAEREYFGKPCGLLDQMGSSIGGFSYIDFKTPSEPISEKIALDVNDFGYTLCVVNTGGDHAKLTQDYADITLECKKISNALGVDFLRDADVSEFYNNIASIRKSCGDRAVLRAFHFFNEQDRVIAQRDALKENRFDDFLKLVNESGQSSYDYLQNLYSTSDINEQSLCIALALTKKYLNGKGACRVHGGGFAGTIQCYIPNDMLDGYKQMIENAFGKDSCIVLSIRSVGGYEIK